MTDYRMYKTIEHLQTTCRMLLERVELLEHKLSKQSEKLEELERRVCDDDCK